MTNVLVTGGAGILGSKVVKELKETGYNVRIMSRKRQPANLLSTTEWAQADLETGQGIANAVAGIDVIVHAASSPFKHTADRRRRDAVLARTGSCRWRRSRDLHFDCWDRSHSLSLLPRKACRRGVGREQQYSLVSAQSQAVPLPGRSFLSGSDKVAVGITTAH